MEHYSHREGLKMMGKNTIGYRTPFTFGECSVTAERGDQFRKINYIRQNYGVEYPRQYVRFGLESTYIISMALLVSLLRKTRGEGSWIC